ncbi:tuberin isoform X2 [Lutzomyia longipalpis]|uniref:tuberin isoform X2 n=1 Tax=Lutzomyia longipalpis TaxID=7200 RepID=UPI002483B0E9|nr:tuberin isoform X2 [Lutzomyia longipalpis]
MSKENTMQKLKQFFKSSKTPGGGLQQPVDFTLTPEIERELRPETPVNQRCKILRELGEDLRKGKVEEGSLQKLWHLTNDLIVASRPPELRQTAFTFYRKLITTQFPNLNLMREKFFRVIQNHSVAEDIGHRLELLRALTDDGKDISFFEDEIGAFMVQWCQAILDAQLMETYLEILINIIKYNAAYLDKEVTIGIVRQTCFLSCTLEDTATVLQCLTVLETIMSYAIFPIETLSLFIVALCKTVNREAFCQTSWKIMRNLLGTDLGYASLCTMCGYLSDPSVYDDVALLCGAVVHTNMGLWGTKVPALRCSPSAVLLSFLRVLRCRHFVVSHEVALSIQRLIQLKGPELTEPTWDTLCHIMEALADNMAFYDKSGIIHNNKVRTTFHETLDDVEVKLRRHEISANAEMIYNLIEKVANDRPEASVFNLIEYRANKISASRPKWLQALNEFMERFFKQSRKTNIRVKAIVSLIQIMDINRAAYEEEILERIVMPYFSNIHQEADLVVRTAAARLLIELILHCDSKRFLELLDIVEKLLNRPFEVHDPVVRLCEADIQDLIVLVEGLIRTFLVKLYRLPSLHTIRIFYLLVGHLEAHYDKLHVFESVNVVRMLIFRWMLDARCNGTFQLGYPDANANGALRFSHYLVIDAKQPMQIPMLQQQQQQQQLGQQQPDVTVTSSKGDFTAISIRRGCKAIVKCLDTERDWAVVQLVLKELPNILQNKALIVGNDVDSLARSLNKLFFRPNLEGFVSSVGKPSISEFRLMILPAISALITYHQHLDSLTQKSIIEVLKLGLFLRDPRVSVHALILMTLEIPDTFIKYVPEVLLEISKISHTTTVSITVLEFLSTLSRLPNHRFTNFVQRQYMCFFAIALPYTNPDRYDHYVVSLAYHVIAAWFLKCRLCWRNAFVSYVLTGLESQIQMSCQEFKAKKDIVPVNEDSSNRKRSSSLTEQGSRQQRRGNVDIKPLNYGNNNALPLEAPYQFHMELAETCSDFMAHYAYSSCSVMPKRMPSAEFLLTGGQTATWLIGHHLITITTSACSTSPIRNGLCDRCNLACRNTAQLRSEATSVSQELRDSAADLQTNKSAQESESCDFTSSTSSSSAATPFSAQQPQKFFRQSSSDGRYSSYSGSLEALSRRGSNPDTESSDGPAGSSSLNKLENPISISSSGISIPQLSTPQSSVDRPRQTCACLCTGWAEVCVRRPTGCTTWVMRIQNQIGADSYANELPLHDLTCLFMPSIGGGVMGNDFMQSSTTSSPQIHPDGVAAAAAAAPERVQHPKMAEIGKRRMDEQETLQSQQSLPQDEKAVQQSSLTATTGPIDIPKQLQKVNESGSFSDHDPDADDVAFQDNDSRSRNPVRRVNSSPEMSSNWRNPFLGGQKNAANSGVNSSASAAAAVAAAQSNNDKGDHEDHDAPTQQQQTSVESSQQKKKSAYGKDMRVSCEAIPEEMAGSTPPSVVGSVTTQEGGSLMIEVTRAKNATLTPGHLTSTGSLPEAAPGTTTLPAEAAASSGAATPRKQHSADEALQPKIDPGTMNLKLPIDGQKVTAKPPQSPAPLSPRLLARNAANKIAGTSMGPFGSTGGGGGGYFGDPTAGDLPRGRSKTISVAREHYTRDAFKHTLRGGTTTATTSSLPRRDVPTSVNRSGINPSFVLLQFYYTGQLQLNVTEKPLLVDAANAKAITLLDLIPPFETHKIGVLYVGGGQCNNETEILKNRFGSFRYAEFLRNLGTLVSIKDAKEHNLYIDLDMADGQFTYIWQDDIVQVVYHVATLMPNKEQDPNCTEKKKHIGNDFVSIVYNESGEEYNLNTIKCQYNYASVIVEPLELNSCRVYVRAKDDVKDYVAYSEPKIVSDTSAPLLARQLALHANLASLVSKSLKNKGQGPYASNWLERLRKIKRLRAKLLNESKSKSTSNEGSGGSQSGGSMDQDGASSKKSHLDDFTMYSL